MGKALIVPALLVIASAAFAEAPTSAMPPASHGGAVREVTVGTVVPSGQNFEITLDERNIDWAYPAWARSLPGAWATVATKERFRSVIRDVVSRKLAVRFPDGPPHDANAGMKISIRVTFSPSAVIDIDGC